MRLGVGKSSRCLIAILDGQYPDQMIMVSQQGLYAPDDRLLDIAGRDSLRTRRLAAIGFDRDVVAIPERSLARMRRCHPASLAVGDPSGKQAGLERIGERKSTRLNSSH